eukprot:gene25943-11622_t
MAPKVSALSAAIATGTTAQPAPPPTKKALLDPAAFPCLAFAEEVDAGEGRTDIAVKFDGIDLAENVHIVGSLPTNTIMNGVALADYELNPWRRRGGEESAPSDLSKSHRQSMELTSPKGPQLSPLGKAASTLFNENVYGSLPKGLSLAQRTKIQQSVPQSPSMGALKEMKQDAVAARTGAGKQMRRQVIHGAVMVFVTAGYSGKRFIFEKAKELGVKSIVLDGPDSWCQLLEQEGVIEKFLPIDFSEADTVLDRCYELLEKEGTVEKLLPIDFSEADTVLDRCYELHEKEGTVEKLLPIDFSEADTVLDRCYESIKAAASELGLELDGITTFCEMAVPLASRLAEKLGLPHNTVEAVDNARDKHCTRDVMEKAGLPTPLHYRIACFQDVAKAGAHVGFPSVIKPVSGAASIGVIRVNNEEDLNRAYERVVRDMSNARIVAGALIEGDAEDRSSKGNAAEWMSIVLMLEEYLDGDEVDCDLIFDNGVPVYGAVADNWPTIEPYFNETGSNQPSILPKSQQEALLELSVRAVQCLGFKLGVFHVECKFTSRGPRLIEVNCRMGGGPVRDMNLLTWGVDLVEEHLMACCGIPVRPPVAKRPLKQVAEYSVNAEKTGIMKHVNFLDEWKAHPDVLDASTLVEPGQKCLCVQDGLPTWVCSLMVSKPTIREAIAFLTEVTDSLIIPIE